MILVSVDFVPVHLLLWLHLQFLRLFILLFFWLDRLFNHKRRLVVLRRLRLYFFRLTGWLWWFRLIWWLLFSFTIGSLENFLFGRRLYLCLGFYELRANFGTVLESFPMKLVSGLNGRRQSSHFLFATFLIIIFIFPNISGIQEGTEINDANTEYLQR